MDPVSLLAELYGDGRDTAQKMRARGITRLKEIAKRQPKELAELLDIPERSAKKILSEARGMLQEDLFEPQMPSKEGAHLRAKAPEKKPSFNPGPADKFKQAVLSRLVRHFP